MPRLRFSNRLTVRIIHLLRDRNANVAVLFALVMIPTIYLLGMTLDYSQAIRKRAQLNAAADAAAIAAVTPTMLTQSTSAATTAATNVFNATGNGLSGLSGAPSLNVNVTNSGLVRTATVSYTAASTNNFPILLGAPAWPINGSFERQRFGRPEHQFLFVARQLAVDGNRSEPGRYQHADGRHKG